MDDRPPAPPSWSPNLERKGGFWADARWYELQLERRMPLVEPMLRQLIFAMPPLPKGCRVCDLLGGSGRVGVRIMEAYPGIQLVLIDDDPVRVELATAKAQDELAKGSEFAGVVQTIGPNDLLPGGPYDVIVAVMSLQFILGQDAALSPDETYLRYQLLFENLGRSLVQGGHLFVGDYLGALSLFKQMRSMEDAGFTDVDCAWRLDDMFVYAGVSVSTPL